MAQLCKTEDNACTLTHSLVLNQPALLSLVYRDMHTHAHTSFFSVLPFHSSEFCFH